MAQNDQYLVLAQDIVALLGGTENITFLTHCVTRLRLNLKDKDLAQVDRIGELKGVLGTQWVGEQLQIIIGAHVSDAYAAMQEVTGLGGEEAAAPADEVPEAKRFTLKGWFQSVLDGLTGSLVPLMPILIGAGLIKLIVLLLEMAGLLTSDMPTYTILTFVGDAGFYFLPVFVGASTAKKFGGNMMLGMLVGAIFIHPDFVSAVSEGTSLSLFGIPVYGASYSSTVFPALLSVWFMCKVEKYVVKWSPAAVRSMLDPFLTVIITLPFAICLFGPIGSVLGDLLADLIIWLYDVTGWVGCAVFAALYPLLITTGMHTGMTPYAISSFTTLGYEPILINANIFNNVNGGVASYAVALRTKDADNRSEAIGAGTTAIFGGVSEPALFGVLLKYKKPLYAVMAGNFVAGAYAGLMKVLAYPSGNCTIFGLVRYISDDPMNLVNMVIALVLGAAVAFVITYLTCKDDPAVLGEEA